MGRSIGGKAGKLGGNKSKKGGGSDEVITKSTSMKSNQEVIGILRSCLFDDSGKDRMNFNLLPMLMAYKKKGLNVNISIEHSLGVSVSQLRIQLWL